MTIRARQRQALAGALGTKQGHRTGRVLGRDRKI
jgi:hypothetical protein